jgi:hypothetical protein
MDGRSFDTWTRRAASAITRRRTLTTLGAVALATTLSPSLSAEAAKDAKKAKKKAKKKCKQQQGECEASVQAFCNQEPKVALQCQNELRGCCAFFASCDATTGSRCLLENNPFILKKVVLP